MATVTIFKNFNEVVEHKPLNDILTDIKTGKFRGPINYLRKCLSDQKQEAYMKAKKGLLAFTPSAKFEGGRKPEFLVEYTGFLILDFDKLEGKKLKEATAKAQNIPYTYASFISPSGNGLKILVKTESTLEKHKEFFEAAKELYEKELGLEMDKSGKDVTRLCFISSDENLYHNPAAAILPLDTTPPPTPAAPANDLGAIFEHCIRQLAYIILSNGECLNEILVREGYAKASHHYWCTELEKYQLLNADAKTNKMGLYAITEVF